MNPLVKDYFPAILGFGGDALLQEFKRYFTNQEQQLPRSIALNWVCRQIKNGAKQLTPEDLESRIERQDPVCA